MNKNTQDTNEELICKTTCLSTFIKNCSL